MRTVGHLATVQVDKCTEINKYIQKNAAKKKGTMSWFVKIHMETVGMEDSWK